MPRCGVIPWDTGDLPVAILPNWSVVSSPSSHELPTAPQLQLEPKKPFPTLPAGKFKLTWSCVSSHRCRGFMAVMTLLCPTDDRTSQHSPSVFYILSASLPWCPLNSEVGLGTDISSITYSQHLCLSHGSLQSNLGWPRLRQPGELSGW